MILVGLDDTDVIDAPGTNQLAKRLARMLQQQWHCRMIVRHQLLVDDRIPYTSKNSSATLVLADRSDPGCTAPALLDTLFEQIADWLRQSVPEGSDPGLCVALGDRVPCEVSEFGRRCKRAVCTRQQAEDVAAAAGLRCAGLAGSELGVIGAVAAVGLAATADDGRVVMIDGEDELAGICSISALQARRVEVRCHASGRLVVDGEIDVGKHLRPNWRSGRIVQYAKPVAGATGSTRQWKAVRLP